MARRRPHAAGEAEARKGAGSCVERLEPDIVHTSLLKRAIRTANLALEECDRLWIPTIATGG